MATRLVEIVNTEWTKITTVGDNGTCWKKSDGGIFVCSTDQEGEATLPLSNTNVTLDRAKRVPLDEDSPEVLQLNPLSPDDAFYALSLKDSAKIVIDSLLGNFGPELVINGNFANWTLDDPDDWIVVGESGIDPMVTEVDGTCRIYTSGANINIRQDFGLEIGKTYKLSVPAIKTTGSINVWDWSFSTIHLVINETATEVAYFTCIADGGLIFGRLAACDYMLDNISIREAL